MKAATIVSYGVCALLFINLVWTLCYYVTTDAWYWKNAVASSLTEFGFLVVFSERDISVMVVAIVMSTLLAADFSFFISTCIASFLVHYLIEMLVVGTKLKLFSLACFVPTVLMCQSTSVPAASVLAATTIPALGLFALFLTRLLACLCR